jgi:hypothetical protein
MAEIAALKAYWQHMHISRGRVAPLAEFHISPVFVQPKPSALDRKLEAGTVSAGLPLNSERNGQLIFSMWMRPSCMCSTALASSMSFRRRPRDRRASESQ